MQDENRVAARLRTNWCEESIEETLSLCSLPHATTSPFLTTRPMHS